MEGNSSPFLVGNWIGRKTWEIRERPVLFRLNPLLKVLDVCQLARRDVLEFLLSELLCWSIVDLISTGKAYQNSTMWFALQLQ